MKKLTNFSPGRILSPAGYTMGMMTSLGAAMDLEVSAPLPTDVAGHGHYSS